MPLATMTESEWFVIERIGVLSSNFKLDKETGYLTVGLSLAPHALAGFGNVCSHATEGCKAACVLWFAGRTVTQGVRAAMMRRTKAFFADRKRFIALLKRDIGLARIRAERMGKPLAVRLNVASDLAWERFSNVIQSFPDVQFYDYTKVIDRVDSPTLPANYTLCYSWNERANGTRVADLLRRGFNVAMVMQVEYFPQLKRIGTLPDAMRGSFLGVKAENRESIIGQHVDVVDGDATDMWMVLNKGRGVIGGLRLKGGTASKAAAVASGFAVAV